MKRKIVLLLTTILCMTGVTPVFAKEYDAPDTANVSVEFSKDSYFTVTLPETIAGNNDTTVTFDCTVEGDITADKVVTVVPQDGDTNTDGTQVVLTDATGKTKDADISLVKTEYTADEIVQKNTSQGSVVFPALSAGTWTGTGKFVINMSDAAVKPGLYANDENTKLTKSWDDLVDDSDVVVSDTTITNSNVATLAGSLVIPDTVTAIGDNAFNGCSELTAVMIPESVVTIGSKAFGGDSKLKAIVASNVETIATDAFANVSNVEYNGDATGNPWGAKSVNDVAVLDAGLYDSNDKLVKSWNQLIADGVITNTNGVLTTGKYDFSTNSNGSSDALDGKLIIANDVTTINNIAFKKCTKLTEVVIPNSVSVIKGFSFNDCTNLKKVTLGDGVTVVENDAFANTALTNITIPKSVNTIGVCVFVNCNNLTRIDVNNGNSSYESVDGVLFNKNGTHLIEYPAGRYDDTYTIPSGVTNIEMGAFSGCGNLVSIDIPNTVVGIDTYAFASCVKLKSITIPDTITTIPDYAFYKCTNLTSISLPNKLISIGHGAFMDCSSLMSVTLPSSVKTIDYSAFANCSNLQSINIPNLITTIEAGTFQDCKNLKITIPNSVTSIKTNAFSNVAHIYYHGSATGSPWGAKAMN